MKQFTSRLTILNSVFEEWRQNALDLPPSVVLVVSSVLVEVIASVVDGVISVVDVIISVVEVTVSVVDVTISVVEVVGHSEKSTFSSDIIRSPPLWPLNENPRLSWES